MDVQRGIVDRYAQDGAYLRGRLRVTAGHRRHWSCVALPPPAFR